MYLVQQHKTTSTRVNDQPVFAWEPVPSPFGGEVRMVRLERACEFAQICVRKLQTKIRIVREQDSRVLAVYTADTLRWCEG